MEQNKKMIIEKFYSNVRGKKFDPTGYNKNHDGAEGQWLEQRMGIKSNNNNAPDLLGYEIKKATKSKITFGDWSPDLVLWKSKRKACADIPQIDRDTQFLKYFGKPNLNKDNRLSWSGEAVPTVRGYNTFGQILQVDEEDNILACYSYLNDQRSNKSELIPNEFHIDNLILAQWLKESMKAKVENKFNDQGCVVCYTDSKGVYTQIGFVKPIDYSMWIAWVKSGIVFFDSGMYAGNSRSYSQWRMNNKNWNELVELVELVVEQH